MASSFLKLTSLKRLNSLRFGSQQKRSFSAATTSNHDLVQLTFDKQDKSVAIVTLNHPKSLNALTVKLGDRFKDLVLNELKPNKEIRSIVLTGAGTAFSAGGDLEFILDRTKTDSLENIAIMKDFYNRFLCVRQLPVPVIAAINGHAIGAGFCLSLACDIRVAAPNAKLGATFVHLGIHPGMGGSHLLPTLAGQQVATEMLLTGATISGEEALKLGIVRYVVDQPNVFTTALDIARKIAKQPRVATQTTLRTIRNAQDVRLQEALEREAIAQALCYQSDDVKEGIAAIREKRTPNFK